MGSGGEKSVLSLCGEYCLLFPHFMCTVQILDKQTGENFHEKVCVNISNCYKSTCNRINPLKTYDNLALKFFLGLRIFF